MHLALVVTARQLSFQKNSMALYISGSGNVLPHGDFDFSGEPDYAQWIDVRQLRRMSRIIKMGVTAALMANRDAGIEVPDGIITGTGYGCLEDTGIFLEKMIVNHERALNPTPFIHSTHNTIGSQIALLMQCQGYNQTFTHNNFSFEHSLVDAFLHLGENPDQTLLVGGADEITKFSKDILKRFRKKIFPGEGATYFVVSARKTDASKAIIEDVQTFYKTEHDAFKNSLTVILSNAGLESKDIHLLVLGESGEAHEDELQNQLIATSFKECLVSRFKNFCGEYPVASSFGLWLAVKAIHDQQIADLGLIKNSDRSIRNVLVYNQYFGTHQSLILIRACHGMQ